MSRRPQKFSLLVFLIGCLIYGVVQLLAPPATPPAAATREVHADRPEATVQAVPAPAPAPAARGTVTSQQPTRFIKNMRIVDQRTGRVIEGTIDLQPTLDRIAVGRKLSHRNDGSVFQNRPLPGKHQPELPAKPPGYYHEYVHPTSGISGPGPQRVIVGEGGEMDYTPDHYQTFIRLCPPAGP